MPIKIVLILMLIFSIISIQSQNLKTAVIYMGIFSMISSFAYLLYAAPDVAIAEAVIGCTLSTILYLVALQKYKVFNICYLNPMFSSAHDVSVAGRRSSLLYIVDEYCADKDLDPYTTYSAGNLEDILSLFKYDLVIHQEGKKISFYGRKRNYHMVNLKSYIEQNRKRLEKDTIMLEIKLD